MFKHIHVLFSLALVLLCISNAMGQVNVEIISRKDTFAFLGSCSDNHVRIHNLPADATVSISRGAAVHVKDDEYVLCRFGHAIEKYPSATLTVTSKGKITFSKEYRISPTTPSGSLFNLILHITNLGDATAKKDTVSLEDFETAVNNGLALSDTNYTVTSLVLSIYYKGSDFIGPYPMQSSPVCRTFAEKKETIRQILKAFSKDNIKRGATIFIDSITAKCESNGTKEVGPLIVYIK